MASWSRRGVALMRRRLVTIMCGLSALAALVIPTSASAAATPQHTSSTFQFTGFELASNPCNGFEIIAFSGRILTGITFLKDANGIVHFQLHSDIVAKSDD